MDTACRSRPGMACGLPQVPGMSSIPRRVLYMFRQGWKDLLQKGLCKVMPSKEYSISIFSGFADRRG